VQAAIATISRNADKERMIGAQGEVIRVASCAQHELFNNFCNLTDAKYKVICAVKKEDFQTIQEFYDNYKSFTIITRVLR
jgi:hypothetical protein